MNYTALVLAAVVVAGCRTTPTETSPSKAELRAAALDHIGRFTTPVPVASSDLIGLTETEVLAKHGLAKLNPEHNADDKKWFSGGRRFPRSPYDDGYIWERCHILTFEDGRVTGHEMVDRRTGHMTVRPREE
jgi:hypothetical protein